MDHQDHVLYLMVSKSLYLMNRWDIDSENFLVLNERYSILEFLKAGYESFHLTGDEGIALDVEQFIQDQGGTIS